MAEEGIGAVVCVATSLRPEPLAAGCCVCELLKEPPKAPLLPPAPPPLAPLPLPRDPLPLLAALPSALDPPLEGPVGAEEEGADISPVEAGFLDWSFYRRG